MNILIVGNGFDLSHYLPTKYDHFMVVMKAIEDRDESQGEMGFDNLFGLLYEKETYFFGYTKAMYKTDEIKISVDKIKELKGQLKQNIWYQYFSDHVREVKTWIDFETKIHDAINIVAIFIEKLALKYTQTGRLSHEICFNSTEDESQIFLTRENCNVLRILRIIKSGYYLDDDIDNGDGLETVIHNIGDPDLGEFRFYINSEYIHLQAGYSTIKDGLILQKLQIHLEDFIKIFDSYLDLIISNLSMNCNFFIKGDSWTSPDKIYSFNYTNTYRKFYAQTADTDFLHGRFGKDQNIVLGVSELQNESLKNLKAYGFTKYHQKLFKDTDYLFLDEYKNKAKQNSVQLDKHHTYPYANLQSETSSLEQIRKSGLLNLDFLIWGHSLDVSDQDYIIDLFSLNDYMSRNVCVTIYYFDIPAKFSLLNNLLAILGKDKVEQWMKNKWLKFEPNPHLAELNKIQPVELPKIAKA